MALAGQLASLLEQVENGEDVVTTDHFHAFCQQCIERAAAGLPLPEAERPALRSALIAAGSRLQRLGPRLQRDCDATNQFAQFSSALKRAAAAICLARAVAALCRLLGNAEASQAVQRSVALLLVWGRRMLQGAAAVDGISAISAAQLLADQLRLMADFWVLGPAHMAGLAPPAELLPWLSAAVNVAAAVTRPGAPLPIDCLAPLARVSANLLGVDLSFTAEGYTPALQDNPALAARLVALLEPGLPAAAVALALPAEQRPGGFTWQLAAELTCVLAGDGLDAALQSHLGIASGSGGASTSSGTSGSSGSSSRSAAAQRLLSAATLLLELAVQRQVEAAEPGPHSVLLCNCSALLGRVCRHLYAAVKAGQDQGAWRRGEDELCMIRCLRKALALVPLVLQLVSSGVLDQLPQPGRQPAHEQARQEGPPERLPGDSPAEWAQAAAKACSALTNVPNLLYGLCSPENAPTPQRAAQREPFPLLDSLAGVPEWCAAALAALRAVPLCAALLHPVQPAGERAAATMEPPRAHTLDLMASISLRVAVGTAVSCEACVRSSLVMASATAEAVRAAHGALRALHSALCRLAHWAAAGGGSGLPTLQRDWRQLLPALASSHSAPGLLAVWHHTQGLQEWVPAPDSRSQTARTAQAAAAATWEAVHALVAGQESQLLQRPQVCVELAGCLGDVAASGPAAVAGCPQLLALLQAALQGAPQEQRAVAGMRQSTLRVCVPAPRLCAGLLGSGEMTSLLAAGLASRSALGGRQGPAQAGAANRLLQALCGLQVEGRRVSRGAESGGGQASAASAASEAGTACQNADWRAGHRKVCSDLAAERQRQRAQQQAAEQA
ncbi:hypothetical protein ABPG75_002770 [Micractinium tetrahymenae]